MSLFDVLRSFMGLPPRNERPGPQPDFRNFMFGEDRGEDVEENIEPDREDFGFRMFSGNVLDMHKFFEQQFEDILRGFQSNWFMDGFNTNERMLEGAERQVDDNPRQKYLKPSYVQPLPPGSHHSYADLDQEINQQVSPSRILDWFPDKGDEKKPALMQPSSSFQSVFSSQVITKKILPNGGVVEERKTVKGGEEVTRVSRELGGMKHILTTTKLADGTTQTQEEFQNLDPDKLSEFNNSWSKK